MQYKNKVLFTGHDRIDFFNMTKHANGRDWWLVFSDIDIQKQQRIFYSMLIGKDTAYIANSQQIAGYEPVPQHPWQIYPKQRIFSPDGKYFITLDLVYGVRIHAFDRCTGQLGPLINLPFNNSIGGIAVSPNSRYLYVSSLDHIFQYELTAPDILATKETVAVYDGYTTPFNERTLFDLCQLGPDGKIYLFIYDMVHYIAKPNKKGAACDVRQHAIQLPIRNFGQPYYPNYRLGPIDGSPCDTLGLNNDPLADFWWFSDSTLSVEFADNSSYEPAAWHWDFGDGAVSQDTNPVHIFPAPGVYTVCLTVSNQYAADTICKEVTVGVTAAREDGPGEAPLVQIYPNPAQAYFTVKYRWQTAGARAVLFDAVGRQVQAFYLPGREGSVRVDTGRLPPGVYFLRVGVADEAVCWRKVVLRQ